MKRMAIAGLALLVLAACGESSTAPTGLAPRFDGGGTYGGGLVVSPPPPQGTTNSESTECTDDALGGGTYGGGLLTSPPPCTVP